MVLWFVCERIEFAEHRAVFRSVFPSSRLRLAAEMTPPPHPDKMKVSGETFWDSL